MKVKEVLKRIMSFIVALLIIGLNCCYLLPAIFQYEEHIARIQMKERYRVEAPPPKPVTPFDYADEPALWLSYQIHDVWVKQHANYRDTNCFIYEIAIYGGYEGCLQKFDIVAEWLNMLSAEVAKMWNDTPYADASIEIWLLNENNLEQVLMISKDGKLTFWLDDYGEWEWNNEIVD